MVGRSRHTSGPIEATTSGSTRLRRIGFNFSLLAGAVALGRISTLLIFSLVAHRLGARALGIFGVATAYTAYWFFLTDLGLSPRLARDGAAEPASLKADFAASFTLKAITLIAPAVTVLVAQLGWGERTSVQLFSLLTAAMCAQSMAYLFESAGRARELNKIEALSSSTQSGVALVLAVVLLLLGGGLVSVGVAAFAAALVRLIASAVLAQRWLGLHPGRAWNPSLLRLSAVYSVVSLASVAYTGIDVAIIGLVTDPTLVGNYIAVSRPLLALGFLVKYASAAALPAAVRVFQTGRDRFLALAQQATALAFLVGCTLALLVVAFAEPLLSVLYGSDFVGATDLLRVTTAYLPLALANAVLAMSLTAAGRQRDQMFGVILGLVATVVLCVALVPPWDSWGATVQFVASEFVLQLVLLWRLRAMDPATWRESRTLLLYLAAAVGALACAALAWVGGPVSLGAALLAVGFALWAASTLRRMRSWLRPSASEPLASASHL